MSNELLFHLISLAIIAIVTILPAFYILEKRKNKNHSFIIKNRRDTFKPWIMLSSIYIGFIVENNKSVIAGILIGLAWFILFSILIYWPLFFKQPQGEGYDGWISKYIKWLEYPNNN
ncbi:Uncharacterized [Syntrophomonas zehnderi OL-4]|uniref:Uncharacterized n=1 Tax=Syntrophomonas zehnderi OL-4 TaxID=690567 RepID=A0A0E4C962_9FIRM|nr:hypothetical protein [Syntrophomonas zehnderi]CFX87076.1 Uncharacterized [Syntrophomonas zehnderi OL-4]